MEGLINKLKIIVPELLEANGIKFNQEVPFEVLTRRFEIAQGVDESDTGASVPLRLVSRA